MSEFLRLHKRNVILLIISFICSVFFFYQGLETFGIKEGVFKITGDSGDYSESLEKLQHISYISKLYFPEFYW